MVSFNGATEVVVIQQKIITTSVYQNSIDICNFKVHNTLLACVTNGHFIEKRSIYI